MLGVPTQEVISLVINNSRICKFTTGENKIKPKLWHLEQYHAKQITKKNNWMAFPEKKQGQKAFLYFGRALKNKLNLSISTPEVKIKIG